MPPALYWYNPPRLIQRANRRCYWLLIPATLCAVSLVRGTSFTLTLLVALLLPVLAALIALGIDQRFRAAEADKADGGLFCSHDDARLFLGRRF